jgi:hypothetical protein
VLMDLLWSDPTTNDGVQGVQPSPRGPGLVTFGPDRVKDFCKVNHDVRVAAWAVLCKLRLTRMLQFPGPEIQPVSDGGTNAPADLYISCAYL